MSTHAAIWMRNSEGTVTGIYCHYDGYLSHVGRILQAHYNDPEKVKALISLGDISYLGNTLESKAGQHVDNNINTIVDKDRYTLAYGERPSEADDVESFMNGWKEEFNYFWNGNDWLFFDDVKWVYLRNVLAEENIMVWQDDMVVEQQSTAGWSDKKIEVRLSNEEVSDLHKHEILDRISVINHLFNDVVMDHPAAKLLTQDKLELVGKALADLYQDAGNMRFEEKPLC
jgi:hypothetical protein